MIHEVLLAEEDGEYAVRINGAWEERDCTSKESVLAVLLEFMEEVERGNPTVYTD